jgi:hypothetical protein
VVAPRKTSSHNWRRIIQHQRYTRGPDFSPDDGISW